MRLSACSSTAAVLFGAAAAVLGCSSGAELRCAPRGGKEGVARFEAGPLSASERRRLVVASETLSDPAAELLVVRVDGPGAGDVELPAVAGEYRVDGDQLVFETSYPLEPGLEYRAVFRPNAPRPTSLIVSLPLSDSTPTTAVEAIYPSASELPENLLKFYLHFSAPMSRGEVWDHLRLIELPDRVVELPFLELDEELWDPSGTRLTVLIDPGRIKRGVRPLEEVGPALVAGGSYALEVDSGWLDAEGRPLEESFRQEFRVGPPDRESPDPKRWEIEEPRVGTRDPLTVRLDEALDHGLLLSSVGVAGPGGEAVPGAPETRDEERTWIFAPDRPWDDGEHQVVVATTLEDLAGNSVGRPFEVDMVEPVRRRIDTGEVNVSFQPRASSPVTEESADH